MLYKPFDTFADYQSSLYAGLCQPIVNWKYAISWVKKDGLAAAHIVYYIWLSEVVIVLVNIAFFFLLMYTGNWWYMLTYPFVFIAYNLGSNNMLLGYRNGGTYFIMITFVLSIYSWFNNITALQILTTSMLIIWYLRLSSISKAVSSLINCLNNNEALFDYLWVYNLLSLKYSNGIVKNVYSNA